MTQIVHHFGATETTPEKVVNEIRRRTSNDSPAVSDYEKQIAQAGASIDRPGMSPNMSKALMSAALRNPAMATSLYASRLAKSEDPYLTPATMTAPGAAQRSAYGTAVNSNSVGDEWQGQVADETTRNMYDANGEGAWVPASNDGTTYGPASNDGDGAVDGGGFTLVADDPKATSKAALCWGAGALLVVCGLLYLTVKIKRG